MRNIYLVLTIFFFIQPTKAQEKYSLGFSFGLGKSYYKNSHETDSNHFKFNNPTSISISTQFVRHLNSRNHIVAQFGYISKKMQFEYSTNEPNIPYAVNDISTEKYDVISLSIGYRRTITIRNIKTFVEIDFVSDYNLNVAISSEGTGNDMGDPNIPLSEDILFKNTGTSHIGEKSYTFGNNFTIGFNLGKKRQYEISGNINIPYNKIQKTTATYSYQWSYQGKEYNHNLDYKGSIIYPSIKFTMYVFNK